MEFTSFTTLVKDEIEKRVGEDYTVRINDVIKNNGVVLSGLTMMQDDSNISPTIYLNNYYEAYEDGNATLTAIVEDVMNIYERNRVNRSVSMKFFMDYEQVKDKIIYKLVNKEKNVELLEDVPHIDYLDMAIVFQCLVSEEMFGNATILIHNAHAKLWNVGAEELYEVAKINTPRLHDYEIVNMKKMIMEMNLFGEMDVDCQEIFEQLPDSLPMYVLSNKMKVQGASCILYDHLLEDFAEAVGSDLYVIPSSIHEILLLPVQGDEDYEALKELVVETNATQVEPEEVLSDSLYYYDREMGELRVM